MKFQQFKGRNLFSLSDFCINLDNTGLVLITGYSADEGSSNGSGKSSLINKGFLWTLFGQTAEGLRTDDVINRHIQQDAVGIVYFLNDNGDTCKIERTRTVSGQSKLSFSMNTTDLSMRDLRQTQELINKTLGHNLHSFIQTEFFGQGNSVPFMKLTTSEKKSVIEKILPFDSLNEWLETTKKAKKQVNVKKLEVEQEKKASQAAISALNSQISLLMAEQTRWQNTQKQKISEITAQFSSLNLKEIEENIDIITNSISSLEKSLDIKNIDEFLGLKENENKKLSSDIINWNYEIRTIQEKIRSLKTAIINKNCPVCNSPIGINPNLPKEIAKHENDILDLTKKVSYNEEIVNINNKTISTLKTSKEKFNTLNNKLLELNTIKESLLKRDIIIDTISKEKNPYEHSIKSANLELEKYQKNFDNAVRMLEHLSFEEKGLDIWEQAFSKDLRLSLYETICPYLTDRTNYHLQKLNNSQITVIVSTETKIKDGIKDEFSIQVSSSSGGGSYALLSGGEQKMVDFAIGLALSDLAQLQTKSCSNILILDEPFVELDSKNSEAIVSYLRDELSRKKESIFLVSNEETLKGLIPNRVHVEKRNGISKVFNKIVN